MKVPVTTAIRHIRKEKIQFEPHLYKYEEKGGTRVSARELGVPEEQVVKTLIMEDDKRQPLIVLMDGLHEVSTKNLARFIGAKSITPCKPEIAQKHSGYLVGGTSPFGTKKTMPVYMEKRIAQCERIYINGGKRGFLVSMSPQALMDALNPQLVEVGTAES